eukprot:SAG11_NODE_2246_length_3639_cov_1.957062_2_plen_71_part_00
MALNFFRFWPILDSALHFRKSGVFGRKAVFGVGWTLGRFGGFGRFCWFSRGVLSQKPPFSLYLYMELFYY